MSSSGSESGSELDHEEEMALRIALERSKVDMGDNSGWSVAATPTMAQREHRSWTLPARTQLCQDNAVHAPHAVSFPCRSLLQAGSGGC